MRYRSIFQWTRMTHRWVRRALLGAACVALVLTTGLRAELTKSDWASWVQAVGSIAAVLAAIAVVGWQDAAARRQRVAAANVIASAILVHINQICRGIDVAAFNMINAIDSEQGSERLAREREFLSRLVFPSTEELLILSGAHPSAAVFAARGCQLTQQAISLLINSRADSEAFKSSVKLAAQQLGKAIREFDRLRIELEEFCG
jgi:type II secretory pathway pseudopilin PulG